MITTVIITATATPAAAPPAMSPTGGEEVVDSEKKINIHGGFFTNTCT